MKHRIITLGRQYGSGGHEIAERLSNQLNLPLYDKVLVEMAAKEMGLSSGEVNSLDEKMLEHFLDNYHTPWETASYLTDYGHPLSNQIFEVQSSIIRNLAEKGPCIIVGRCADFILRGFPDSLHVFICASREYRIRRTVELYHLTEKEAAEKIRRTDRMRKNYYETYTDMEWGASSSHQLVLNSGLLGMERTIDLLQYLYRK